MLTPCLGYAFLLYLQIDFIRSLEYTIVSECECKLSYGEIIMESFLIKKTFEKCGIIVRRVYVLCIE